MPTVEDMIALWESLGYRVNQSRNIETQERNFTIFNPLDTNDIITLSENAFLRRNPVTEGAPPAQAPVQETDAAQDGIDNTPPPWWDTARDGAFPSTWDNSVLGQYPSKPVTAFDSDTGKTEPTGELVPDDKAAQERIDRRRAITTEDQEFELPQGSPLIISRDGFDFQFNPKTGEHDIRVGRSQVQQDQGFQGFETPEEARADPTFGPGDEVFRDPGTNRFFIRPSTAEAPQKQGEVVTIGGQQFIRQPDGRLQHITPNKRTFTQQLEDMILAGRGDEALLYSTIRQQVFDERLSIIDAFNFIAPIAQNPEHFRELMDALMGETGQQLPAEQVAALTAQAQPNIPVVSTGLPPSRTPLGEGEFLTGFGGTAPSQGFRATEPLQGFTATRQTGFGTNIPTTGQPPFRTEGSDFSRLDFEQQSVATQIEAAGGLENSLKLTPEQRTVAREIEAAGGLQTFLRRQLPQEDRFGAQEDTAASPTSTDPGGLFDPARVSAIEGMRTEEEEAELARLLGTAEFGAGRGVTNVPQGAVNRIRELQRKSAFVPRGRTRDEEDELERLLSGGPGLPAGLTLDQVTTPGFDLTKVTGQQVSKQERIEGLQRLGGFGAQNQFNAQQVRESLKAFPGTPFFPIPKNPQTPEDVAVEKFIREEVNPSAQRRFVARGRTRRGFR